MESRARHKVILVTGASSGIGAAIARRLTADGHRVFGTSRKVSGTPVNGVTMLPLDVCDDDSVHACVAAVIDQAGAIDVLINNAGYLLAGAIEDITITEARAQFETNFFGTVRMVSAVLPLMRARRSGLIVNMSSLAGRVPAPFWGFYNASKFAVEGYTESLRYELTPLGIQVAMVEPGAIKTPFYAGPPVQAPSAYSPWRERAFETMAAFERKAPGPEVVADVVSGIVRSRRPRLRYAVTLEGKLLPFMRRLFPGSVFESATRFTFHLDKATGR
jgi:NAD(P)-dependent dehydrogenase (short-subunit alcohol dehydrogenase family)